MSFYWSGRHQEVECPPKVPVLERDRAGFTFISSLASCSCPMVVSIPLLSVLISDRHPDPGRGLPKPFCGSCSGHRDTQVHEQSTNQL